MFTSLSLTDWHCHSICHQRITAKFTVHAHLHAGALPVLLPDVAMPALGRDLWCPEVQQQGQLYP